MLLIQTQNLFHHYQKTTPGPQMKVLIFHRHHLKKQLKHLEALLHPWQLKELKTSEQHYFHFQTSQGHLVLTVLDDKHEAHPGDLHPLWPIAVRELMGQVWSTIRGTETVSVQFEFHGLKKNETMAALRGLSLASYSFKHRLKKEFAWSLTLNNKPPQSILLKEAQAWAQATSLCRDLVNLPPNLLNPKSYAKVLVQNLGKLPHLKVKIHDAKELEKKGHQLILAVGQGALHPPCIVEIDYHPNEAKGLPLLFVGKGITFDSGGLDIKTAEGMRFMKKDMAGSAALVGLAHLLATSLIKKRIKIYLSLAENAISEKSFHPGDVFSEPNGVKVEIHNTDAEGRLVMASAMVLAQTQHPESSCLINISTLTGAMRIALGPALAGLFSNYPQLNQALFKAGQMSGDYCWPMPLFRPYQNMLKSQVADTVNSANGHGGAITAALFLEKFIGQQTKWAHLDIYGSNDQISGAIQEIGANAQMVALLFDFVQQWR